MDCLGASLPMPLEYWREQNRWKMYRNDDPTKFDSWWYYKRQVPEGLWWLLTLALLLLAFLLASL
jgi:hypothetical protein